MALILEIEIEKTGTGKFNAILRCNSTHGKGCAFASLLQNTIAKAATDTLEPLIIIAPNLTQEELDIHYERYGYP